MELYNLTDESLGNLTNPTLIGGRLYLPDQWCESMIEEQKSVCMCKPGQEYYALDLAHLRYGGTSPWMQIIF